MCENEIGTVPTLTRKPERAMPLVPPGGIAVTGPPEYICPFHGDIGETVVRFVATAPLLSGDYVTEVFCLHCIAKHIRSLPIARMMLAEKSAEGKAERAPESEPAKPSPFVTGWTRRGNLEIRGLSACPQIVIWPDDKVGQADPADILAIWHAYTFKPYGWYLQFLGGRPFQSRVNQEDFRLLAECGQNWLAVHRSGE